MSEDNTNQNPIPPKAAPPAGAPGAPRPITVRLKPVKPAGAAPVEPQPAADPVATPTTESAAQAKMTARVPIPDLDASIDKPGPQPITPVKPTAAAPTPTVRLRPVAAPAGAEGTTAAAPATPSPLRPVAAPVPGSKPLPDGPKPPSAAQTQAAKSKTSRISLDSAIGVAPTGEDKSEPKTIRLKRPSDLSAAPAPKVATAPIRQTSRIPDSALPSAEESSATVTQKKTLKIRRPGSTPAATSDSGTADSDFPAGTTLTPLSPIGMPQEESKVFTTIAMIAGIAALFVMMALTWCLAAHTFGASHGPNASATWEGPDLPWPGRLE